MSPADPAIQEVADRINSLDPSGTRIAQVLRKTFDQLYDGQNTGRYRWEQLYKTEKTHYGTLVEINLHREFGFENGELLDYRIAGYEVDCKYSQRMNGWMIPPEARDQLCLLVWADDAAAIWSMGLVRMRAEFLSAGTNRDQKSSLNEAGRQAVFWLHQNAPLPPNVLLQLDQSKVAEILRIPSGAKRVNELFRLAMGMRVGEAAVATMAQQKDYMKRVRSNGGARTALRSEGIIILGQYKAHREIAKALGVPVPGDGESVSVRLAPATKVQGIEIDGGYWRVAFASDPVVPAPELPEIA